MGIISEKRLQEIYGDDARQAEARFQHVAEEYRARFKAEPEHYFTSPGRTEIIGNHTDHNGGRILAASITLDTICAAGKTDDGVITIISEGYRHAITVDLKQLDQAPKGQGSTSLVAGIGGTLGAMLTGVFASASVNGVNGLLYGNPRQLLVQTISVIATWGYVYLASRLILLLVDKTLGLRADPDEEASGLDLNEHHERGYSL